MAKHGPRIEIHQNPLSFHFKKPCSDEDALKLTHVIHSFMSDGLDPRRIHFAFPDLMLSSKIKVNTKIERDGAQIQTTSMELKLRKEEDSDVTN